MTCTGGGDQTNRKSTGLSDCQVVWDLDKFSGKMHMKVWVKVRCQVVMTRTGDDDRTNRKSTGLWGCQVMWELDKITGGMHMKVWVNVECQFVTTRTRGDDRTNRKSIELSDFQVVWERRSKAVLHKLWRVKMKVLLYVAGWRKFCIDYTMRVWKEVRFELTKWFYII